MQVLKQLFNRDLLLPLLLGAIAAVLFYRSPFVASDFRWVPDSQEYSIGAYRMMNEGRYSLRINSAEYPPRYPPWFSLIIAPFYIMPGSDPGNSIWPVYFFAIAGVVAAFFAGKAISGTVGGVLSSGLIMLLPLYRHFSQEVMTDVPTAALYLIGLVLYLRIAVCRSPRLSLFVLAGIVSGLAYGIRSSSLTLLLPFVIIALREMNYSLIRLVTAAVPSMLVTIATMWYNAVRFGTPWRNGYKFWCPVPYDFPKLTFSLDYLRENVLQMNHAGVFTYGCALIIAGSLVFFLRRRWNDVELVKSQNHYVPGLRFLLLTMVPILVFYSVYFFNATRFYLPVVAVLASLVGSFLGGIVQRLPSKAVANVFVSIALISSVIFRINQQEPPPLRRLCAENIVRCTSSGSVIISAIDGAYLEFICNKRGTRTFLPVNRTVEYASKLICRKRPERLNPLPSSSRDHRCIGLRMQGAEEVYPKTADEDHESIAKMLRKGARVYLAVTYSLFCRKEIDALSETFSLRHVSYDLFELSIKSTLPPVVSHE
jgi:hypothetical protein